MITTLNKILSHSPCSQGWQKLLKHLGKSGPDDEPLSIIAILEINGLDDALWCLRSVKGQDKPIRLYTVWCARQIQHLLRDPRSIAALDVAERFANGQATREELSSAWAAARDAVESSAWGERAAPWAATAAATAGGAADAAAWAAGATESAGAAKAAQETELRRICS